MTILTAETGKEKESWKTEVDLLQRQLAARSQVCDFLKQGSDAARYVFVASLLSSS